MTDQEPMPAEQPISAEVFEPVLDRRPRSIGANKDTTLLSPEEALVGPQIEKINVEEVVERARSFDMLNVSDGLLTLIGRSETRPVPDHLRGFVTEIEREVFDKIEFGQPQFKRERAHALFNLELEEKDGQERFWIATSTLATLNAHREMDKVVRTPARILETPLAKASVLIQRLQQQLYPNPTALFSPVDYFNFQQQGLRTFLVFGRLDAEGQENVFGIAPSTEEGELVDIDPIPLASSLRNVFELKGKSDKVFVYGFINPPQGMEHAA